MGKQTLKGIQLPPDSTGKVTAAFTIEVFDDSDGSTTEVTVPATAIINAEGYEIGGEILDLLGKIESHLDEIRKHTEMQTHILGG